MALTESKEYKAFQHGVAAFAVKEYEVVKKAGVEKHRKHISTRAVCPGDDISMYPEEIQGMCNGYWTDNIVAAYDVSRNVEA